MNKQNKTETLVERVERELTALKGVFRRSRLLGVIVVLGILSSGAFASRAYWRPSSVKQESTPPESPPAAVSISCRPETFPIEVKQGTSIYGVQLHPKWGNVIQAPTPQTQPRARSVWPNLQFNNVGYRCQISNDVDKRLSGIFVPLQVKFFSESAPVRNRLVDVPIPESIDSHGEFLFYIADDTGWLPEVKLPERIRGRIGPNTEVREILVHYSTFDGKPSSLNGFGVQTP